MVKTSVLATKAADMAFLVANGGKGAVGLLSMSSSDVIVVRRKGSGSIMRRPRCLQHPQYKH